MDICFFGSSFCLRISFYLLFVRNLSLHWKRCLGLRIFFFGNYLRVLLLFGNGNFLKPFVWLPRKRRGQAKGVSEEFN